MAPHINYVALKENDFSMIANCPNVYFLKYLKNNNKAADESEMAGDFNALSTLTLSYSSGDLLGRHTNRREHSRWETRY